MEEKITQPLRAPDWRARAFFVVFPSELPRAKLFAEPRKSS